MKKYIHLNILILFQFPVLLGFGQIDSTLKFESDKGNLLFPVSKIIEIESSSYSNKTCIVNELNPNNVISFILDTSEQVFASYEGRIVSVIEIDGQYAVITKFGDYFLTYYGLRKPLVKQGEYLHKGEFISTVLKDFDNKFRITVLLYYLDYNFNPLLWFAKQRCI